MADTARPERLYCYQCGSLWARQGPGSLQCPTCTSDFVEIIEENTPPEQPQHPQSDGPFAGHRTQRTASPSNAFPGLGNWSGPPEYDHYENAGNGTTYRHYRSGDGRFSFTRTSFRTGSPPQNQPADDASDNDPLVILRNATALINALSNNRPDQGPWGARYSGPRQFSMIEHREEDVGAGPGMFSVSWRLGPRDANRAQPDSSPFAHLNDVLGQLTAQHGRQINGEPPGEVVSMQTLLSSLLQNLAAGREELDPNRDQPATQYQLSLVQTLPYKGALKNKGAGKADYQHFNSKADCGICMDNVEPESEISMLPCKHWFHSSCITPWLNEHNTCPHCRGTLKPNEGEQQQASGSRSDSTPEPSSSGTRTNPYVIPDSPPHPITSGNGSRTRSAAEASSDVRGSRFNQPEGEGFRRSSRNGRQGHSGPAGWVWNLFNHGSH
ncbi:hypothetical protein AJ79_01527 [Helicocarpus griseus UAMH5409]|uniref:RING-type domain-containing protein n=1 Tax=Helicocarpus griseus UAMH5409 TaxID=1447875 RepID=A0A2B7Y765_9EURO|nr:hypothetical protein AJ79_01527 [Helicocarpus griseus UAMH5409]